MIPLSARNSLTLVRSAKQLNDLIADQRDTLDLYTFAGNLSRRRTHYSNRVALTVTSLDDLQAKLTDVIEEKIPSSTVPEGIEHRIATVFSG